MPGRIRYLLSGIGKCKDWTRLQKGKETELLVREQIGRLVLIHAMTIHYDM